MRFLLGDHSLFSFVFAFVFAFQFVVSVVLVRVSAFVEIVLH